MVWETCCLCFPLTLASWFKTNIEHTVMLWAHIHIQCWPRICTFLSRPNMKWYIKIITSLMIWTNSGFSAYFAKTMPQIIKCVPPQQQLSKRFGTQIHVELLLNSIRPIPKWLELNLFYIKHHSHLLWRLFLFKLLRIKIFLYMKYLTMLGVSHIYSDKRTNRVALGVLPPSIVGLKIKWAPAPNYFRKPPVLVLLLCITCILVF